MASNEDDEFDMDTFARDGRFEIGNWHGGTSCCRFTIKRGILSYQDDSVYLNLCYFRAFNGYRHINFLHPVHNSKMKNMLIYFPSESTRDDWLLDILRCGAKGWHELEVYEWYTDLVEHGDLIPSLSFPTITNGQYLIEMQREDLKNTEATFSKFGMAASGVAFLVPAAKPVAGVVAAAPVIYDFIRGESKADVQKRLQSMEIRNEILVNFISEFTSQMKAACQRYMLMCNKGVNWSTRRQEVPGILTTCDTHLGNFMNQHHVLFKHPLIAAPYMTHFATFCMTFAAVAAKLSKDHLGDLKRMVKNLLECLRLYAEKVVSERLQGIVETQNSIIDNLYPLNENLGSFTATANHGLGGYRFRKCQDYKKKIRRIYEDYFAPLFLQLDHVIKELNKIDNIECCIL